MSTLTRRGARANAAARLPGIQAERIADPAAREALAALREWVEVRLGARGDKFERAVTFRDLEDPLKRIEALEAAESDSSASTSASGDLTDLTNRLAALERDAGESFGSLRNQVALLQRLHAALDAEVEALDLLTLEKVREALNVFRANQSVLPLGLRSEGPALVLDAGQSNNFSIEVAAPVNVEAPARLTDGMVLNFVFQMDATGGHEVTFDSVFDFGAAPITVPNDPLDITRAECYYDAFSGKLLCELYAGYNAAHRAVGYSVGAAVPVGFSPVVIGLAEGSSTAEAAAVSLGTTVVVAQFLSALGRGTATAVGVYLESRSGVGAAAGASTLDAVGLAGSGATGSTSGAATVAGTGAAEARAAGAVTASASATAGSSGGTVAAVGSSAGSSTATGAYPPYPIDLDANYPNVSALLHFNGIGANFIDQIGNVWTANGNATQSTSSPIVGPASGLFDGSGDYLSAVIPNLIGTGDFAIDAKLRINSLASDGEILCISSSSMLVTQFDLVFEYKTSGALRGSIQNGAGTANVDITSAAGLLTTGVDYHVRFVADGSTARLAIDGAQVASGAITGTRVQSQQYVRIGYLTSDLGGAVTRYYNGRIDDLRVTRGTTRETMPFTAPTAQLPSWPALSYVSSPITTTGSTAADGQGVATDGTHVWFSNSTEIRKYTKANTLVTSRTVSGDNPTDKAQINGMYYKDGVLYVSAAKYTGGVGTSYIVEYDPDTLAYITHRTLSIDGFSEGLTFKDSHWWVCFHATKVIAKYDASWNHVATYSLGFSVTGSSGGYGAGTGYDGIAWCGDYLLANIHEIYDQDYVDIYHFSGSSFSQIARLIRPATKATQGMAADPVEPGVYWFAERNYAGTDGVAKCTLGHLVGAGAASGAGTTTGQAVYLDEFSTDSIANYTTGGDAAATWSISGGKLTASRTSSPFGPQATCVFNGYSAADSAVQVTLGGNAYDAGLLLRYTDNNNYYLLAACDDIGANPTQNIRLYKKVGGGYTLLGFYDATWANGTSRTIRFSAVGTALKAYLDGVEVISATDSALSSGSVGMRSNAAGTNSNQKDEFDNFMWGLTS